MIFSRNEEHQDHSEENCLSPFALSALAASLALIGGSVIAQTFPTRPIRVVVPFPAGGNVDTYIRQLARQMENTLGQSLVVARRRPSAGPRCPGALTFGLASGGTVLCKR